MRKGKDLDLDLYRTSDLLIQIGEAQKHADPDPQHSLGIRSGMIAKDGSESRLLIQNSVELMCTVGLEGVGLKSKSPSKNWSKIIHLQEKYDILPEGYVMVSVRDP